MTIVVLTNIGYFSDAMTSVWLYLPCPHIYLTYHASYIIHCRQKRRATLNVVKIGIFQALFFQNAMSKVIKFLTAKLRRASYLQWSGHYCHTREKIFVSSALFLIGNVAQNEIKQALAALLAKKEWLWKKLVMFCSAALLQVCKKISPVGSAGI